MKAVKMIIAFSRMNQMKHLQTCSAIVPVHHMCLVETSSMMKMMNQRKVQRISHSCLDMNLVSDLLDKNCIVFKFNIPIVFLFRLKQHCPTDLLDVAVD